MSILGKVLGSCIYISHIRYSHLAAVLALYSKEAGAGSNHAWQQSANSIGAVSYLVVQAYEAPAPNRTNLFRAGLKSQNTTRAEKAFLHIPATQFLCRLKDLSPSIVHGKVVLSEEGWLVFQKVASTSPLCEKLADVIKQLNVAIRGRKATTE